MKEIVTHHLTGKHLKNIMKPKKPFSLAKTNHSYACKKETTGGRPVFSIRGKSLKYHEKYFSRTLLVLFLIRVKTITAQAKTHGGIGPVENLSFFAHSGVSIITTTIDTVITATNNIILVMGLSNESCIYENRTIHK